MVAERLRQRRAGAQALSKAHAWAQPVHLSQASRASCPPCGALSIVVGSFVLGLRDRVGRLCVSAWHQAAAMASDEVRPHILPNDAASADASSSGNSGVEVVESGTSSFELVEDLANMLEPINAEESLQEGSNSGRVSSAKPWDALNVSSVQVTNRACSLAAQGRSNSPCSADGLASRVSLTDKVGLRGLNNAGVAINMGQAFSDAFNRVSDGGAASLTLPWETPLMRAIFSDDPSEIVNLSARPLCMVGSVPEVPVPCAQELQDWSPRSCSSCKC